MPSPGAVTGARAPAAGGSSPVTADPVDRSGMRLAAAMPDPRLVELLVCSTALAGARLTGRLAVPALVLAGVIGVHGLVLVRWPARRALRLACFALMLVLLGVLPTARYVQATDRGVATLGHDGGVHVSDQAIQVLLDGRDPYQASYASVLARWRIDVQGRPATNPLVAHYPYWPGSLALLGAVEAPLQALGAEPDPRLLYLLVYCLLGLWLGWWSLRERGDLGLALAVCLSPLLLPYLWQGVNDVLLVAGMVVMAVALARGRVVLAGLAVGVAVSVKLLVAPMVLLFLVWLVAQTRRGPLARGRAWQAAAAMLAPALLVALPFLAWHPADFLTDAVGYHLGLVEDAYPIAGSGLPALLLHIGVLTDPFGPAPAWATTLPATAVILMGCWLVWSRPSPRSLLGATGVVILGLLFFHRSFMSYYIDVPATALLLAALLPRPAMISRSVDGPRVRGRPTSAHETSTAGAG
jgi:type IV secretory pathway VirB3-like protein